MIKAILFWPFGVLLRLFKLVLWFIYFFCIVAPLFVFFTILSFPLYILFGIDQMDTMDFFDSIIGNRFSDWILDI